MDSATIKLAFLAFFGFCLAGANHPGADHGHGHQHGQQQQQQQQQQQHHMMSSERRQPFVSSFSHKLPGTGSYMSVTRYFNVPSSLPTNPDNLSESSRSSNSPFSPQHEQAPRDYFDPWSPRFKVIFFVLLKVNFQF
jgi:hypothetical protein